MPTRFHATRCRPQISPSRPACAGDPVPGWTPQAESVKHHKQKQLQISDIVHTDLFGSMLPMGLRFTPYANQKHPKNIGKSGAFSSYRIFALWFRRCQSWRVLWSTRHSNLTICIPATGQHVKQFNLATIGENDQVEHYGGADYGEGLTLPVEGNPLNAQQIR